MMEGLCARSRTQKERQVKRNKCPQLIIQRLEDRDMYSFLCQGAVRTLVTVRAAGGVTV